MRGRTGGCAKPSYCARGFPLAQIAVSGARLRFSRFAFGYTILSTDSITICWRDVNTARCVKRLQRTTPKRNGWRWVVRSFSFLSGVLSCRARCLVPRRRRVGLDQVHRGGGDGWAFVLLCALYDQRQQKAVEGACKLHGHRHGFSIV